MRSKRAEREARRRARAREAGKCIRCGTQSEAARCALCASENRGAARKAAYGEIPEAIRAKVEEAEAACDICGRVAKLVVDHRHSDGRVRGAICSSCNRKVGELETGRGLSAVVEYIRRDMLNGTT